MAGACVSISVDGFSRLLVHPTPKLPSGTAWMVGAADDVTAIVILLTIVWIAAKYKARNTGTAAASNKSGTGAAIQTLASPRNTTVSYRRSTHEEGTAQP
jgi:hypothetical protein